MRFDHLQDWLAWQESLNPAEIDLGLDRVEQVLERLGRSSSFPCALITVAGTNGKGSVVAMLESIASAAGLTVGSYTSPHLFEYNERIKLNRQPIDDQSLCEVFDSIDQARCELPLTYFEFGTLAAIEYFFRVAPDLVVLEVGLGGRLDAVNIMDADVSVLTSVAIDHVDWLGDDRESIGFEKAGVFRENHPVICGDEFPPKSVIAQAKKLHCKLLQIGTDYVVEGIQQDKNNRWRLRSCLGDIKQVEPPRLFGEFQKSNAATAILAIQSLLQQGLIKTKVRSNVRATFSLPDIINQAMQDIQLPGRYQQINEKPAVYVDVAHNLQAAQALADQMADQMASSNKQVGGKTWAIVAMLADKDVAGVLDTVSSQVDRWCFAGLADTARGLGVEELIDRLADTEILSGYVPTEQLHDDLKVNQCTMLSENILLASTVVEACIQVLSMAEDDDQIVIFGSFYTVAQAMEYFNTSYQSSL